MAVKESKQSVSKTIKSSSDQDAIRRAKKAKQRKSGGRRPVTSGYLDGLVQDRLAHHAENILSVLEVKMTSSGMSCDLQLKAATSIYMAEFTMNTARMSLWQRHKKAAAKALKELEGNESLMRYARGQLDNAFKRTQMSA